MIDFHLNFVTVFNSKLKAFKEINSHMENPSDGKSALGLDPNVAAGLAYIPVCAVNLIMSIIIIATDKTNKLARFHAFQSLLLLGAAIVGYIGVWIITMIIVVGTKRY